MKSNNCGVPRSNPMDAETDGMRFCRETSVERYPSSGMVAQRRLPTDLVRSGEKNPHSVCTLQACLGEVAENVEMGEIQLKDDGMGRTQTPIHKADHTCERKERQIEIAGGAPALGGIEVTDSFAQYCTAELKSNGVDKGIRERTSGEVTLEYLLERMDKLGALCTRIESHVQEALNNMERRLQMVESHQTLPTLSVPTKIEEVTLRSGLSSLPNLCSKPLVSCPEILSADNGNCKHIHEVGMPSGPCTEFHSTPFDAILDKSMLGSVDLQVVSKEERFLGDSQGADCAEEEKSAGSVISANCVCEQPAPAKRPAPSIEEALAAALSAFSASVGCPAIEATGTSTEAPCCSSELENSNVDDKDARYSGGIGCEELNSHGGIGCEELNSHEAAITDVCTAALCGSMEVDITDGNEVCYDEGEGFGPMEGARYMSQEGMDLVPYGSSQGSQDARHGLHRRGKIGDSRDHIAAGIRQTCKPGAAIMINQKREIMLSEDKIESRSCNSVMALAGKDPDPVYVIQDTGTWRQESSMVHAGQEQLQPLEGPEELQCSKWSKHNHLIVEEGHDLIVNKSSAFIPVIRNCESDILSIGGICSSLINGARKTETSNESNNSKQSPDKPAMSKLHTDLPSLLGMSFTACDTCQMRMPLEALLYNPTPEQHRETVSLQESAEQGPLLNFSEPIRPHGLFFVEDEDLGDFLISSVSTLIVPVSTGNREDRGMMPGASPNFESLL